MEAEGRNPRSISPSFTREQSEHIRANPFNPRMEAEGRNPRSIFPSFTCERSEHPPYNALTPKSYPKSPFFKPKKLAPFFSRNY
jgi:hypothetical protein